MLNVLSRFIKNKGYLQLHFKRCMFINGWSNGGVSDIHSFLFVPWLLGMIAMVKEYQLRKKEQF